MHKQKQDHLQKDLNKERLKLQSKFKDVYIYAAVNLDNCLNMVVPRSKKIREVLELNKLAPDFIDSLRKQKNFRICLDAEIQKFIYRKELNADFRNMKRPVYEALQDFVINRIIRHVHEQNLKKDYKLKANEIESTFIERINQLLNSVQKK